MKCSGSRCNGIPACLSSISICINSMLMVFSLLVGISYRRRNKSHGVFSLVSIFPAGETTNGDPPRGDQPFTPSIQTVDGPNVLSNQLGLYVAKAPDGWTTNQLTNSPTSPIW